MMESGNEHIGFVIWGVRNGYSPDLLGEGLVPEVRNKLSDGIRQICQRLNERFYSIDRSEGYALVTVFKPDATDHVGRKVYIAITLFIPLTRRFRGNVVRTLDRLLDYYEAKQGRDTGNTRFTAGMFREQFADLGTDGYGGQSGHGDLLGVKGYEQVAEVEGLFKEPFIPGYRKVFFFRKPIPGFSGREDYREFSPKQLRSSPPPLPQPAPQRRKPWWQSTEVLAGRMVLGLAVVIAVGILLYGYLTEQPLPEAPVDTVVCVTPSNLMVLDTTETGATLKWDTVPGAVGYLIQHRAGNDAWKNSRVDSNSTRLTGLVGGLKYECRVFSICLAGTSQVAPTEFSTLLPLTHQSRDAVSPDKPSDATKARPSLNEKPNNKACEELTELEAQKLRAVEAGHSISGKLQQDISRLKKQCPNP